MKGRKRYVALIERMVVAYGRTPIEAEKVASLRGYPAVTKILPYQQAIKEGLIRGSGKRRGGSLL